LSISDDYSDSTGKI